jgi:hypothetical protein
MNIQIMNSNNNEWYNFDVDNTTTMINIKEQYAQQLNLNVNNLRVWISSDICPIIKKEWIPEADHYTLAQCNILKPEAHVFIIIKSF